MKSSVCQPGEDGTEHGDFYAGRLLLRRRSKPALNVIKVRFYTCARRLRGLVLIAHSSPAATFTECAQKSLDVRRRKKKTQ